MRPSWSPDPKYPAAGATTVAAGALSVCNVCRGGGCGDCDDVGDDGAGTDGHRLGRRSQQR